MLLALIFFPILILGDQWHSAQIVDLRHDSTRFVALGIAALAAAVILAAIFDRWPIVLPLTIVFALPFRVPLHAGGDTANLLVPLYLVIAGGVLATAVKDWGTRPAGPVPGEGGALRAGHGPSSTPPTPVPPAGDFFLVNSPDPMVHRATTRRVA